MMSLLNFSISSFSVNKILNFNNPTQICIYINYKIIISIKFINIFLKYKIMLFIIRNGFLNQSKYIITIILY
jgi:hypothetical protein